jgi:signal transduction histidine kinase
MPDQDLRKLNMTTENPTRAGSRRLAWWDGRARSLLFDLAIAGGVGALTAFDRAGKPFTAIWLVAGVAIALALLVRRRFPVVTAAVALLASFVFTMAPAVVIVVYTVASRRGTSSTTWAVVGLGLITVFVPGLQNSGGAMFWPPWPALFLTVTVAMPTMAGLWIAQRARLMESLRDRADQAERERDLLAERAVGAERRRIAREMHDVVAHRVSLIALQAGALSVTSDDERVTPIAEVIQKASATAMTELREVLRALRDDGGDQEATDGEARPWEPYPTLATIRTLVDDAVTSGMRIDLTLPDPAPEVSSTIERAAYRVVQESLTNAAKHAPGAPVRVEVVVGQEGLALQVVNTRGTERVAEPPESGFGLLGMRERVSLAGGTLRTEPTADGGFRVRAWLPVDRDEAPAVDPAASA